MIKKLIVCCLTVCLCMSFNLVTFATSVAEDSYEISNMESFKVSLDEMFNENLPSSNEMFDVNQIPSKTQEKLMKKTKPEVILSLIHI